jgi:hypothetical protein
MFSHLELPTGLILEEGFQVEMPQWGLALEEAQMLGWTPGLLLPVVQLQQID